MELMLLHEEIPDDDALLDELIALLDKINPQDSDSYRHASKRSARLKAWSIVSACVFYGILLSLVMGALLISQGNKKPIFGYSFMNVLTWSMQSEIPQGSLVIIKKVNPGVVEIGNDITYVKDTETAVTHRVIGIMEDYEGSGERGFETQGIENDSPDFEIVQASNVIGMVRFHVPRIGNWLEWLRNNMIITLSFTAGFIVLFILLKGALQKNPEEEKKTKPRFLWQPRDGKPHE